MGERVEDLSAAYMAIAEVVIAAGAAPLSRHLGCYAHTLPGTPWRFAINGHDSPHEIASGFLVPPFSAVVWFNEWPAAFIDPTGGVVLAGSEDDLIAALHAEAARLRGEG